MLSAMPWRSLIARDQAMERPPLRSLSRRPQTNEPSPLPHPLRPPGPRPAWALLRDHLLPRAKRHPRGPGDRAPGRGRAPLRNAHPGVAARAHGRDPHLHALPDPRGPAEPPFPRMATGIRDPCLAEGSLRWEGFVRASKAYSVPTISKIFLESRTPHDRMAEGRDRVRILVEPR